MLVIRNLDVNCFMFATCFGCSDDDDEDARGNPLVTGYLEDLGTDDEQVSAINQTTPSAARQADLSSDDDEVESDVEENISRSRLSDERPSPAKTTVLAPQPATFNLNGSVSPKAASLIDADFSSNRTSIKADVHSANANDSSDDMDDTNHIVVLKDEDVSDAESADQV